LRDREIIEIIMLLDHFKCTNIIMQCEWLKISNNFKNSQIMKLKNSLAIWRNLERYEYRHGIIIFRKDYVLKCNQENDCTVI
jgi:hypothetical protein